MPARLMTMSALLPACCLWNLHMACRASVLATFFSAQMCSAGGVSERRLVTAAPASVESASKRAAALRACKTQDTERIDAAVMAEPAIASHEGVLAMFFQCPDACSWRRAGAAPGDSAACVESASKRAAALRPQLARRV